MPSAEVDSPRWLSSGRLALIYLPLFTVGLGYGAVLPILPNLLERLHTTAAAEVALPLHAGLLTGIYIVAFVVAAPVWGRVTDHRGSRLVMMSGLFGYAAATVWFGLATSLAMAYAARFVAGAFAAGLLPATSALIAKRCRGAERTRHLAWVNAASVVGFLVGPAITGWVHGALVQAQPGIASALHVTAVPIWTTGVIALMSGFGVVWGGRFDRADTSANAQAAPSRSTRTPLPLPEVSVLSGLGAFGLGAFEVGLTLQSGRSWGFSASELAGLFVACSLVMLVIQFVLYEPLQRYLRPQTLIIGGFVAMATGFLLLPNSSAYGAVVALVTFISFGSGLLLPTLSVATADRAEAAVGSAVGYQNAAANLGQAAGSAAAGWLFSALPLGSFGVVAGVMVASAAVAGVRLHRARASVTPVGSNARESDR